MSVAAASQLPMWLNLIERHGLLIGYSAARIHAWALDTLPQTIPVIAFFSTFPLLFSRSRRGAAGGAVMSHSLALVVAYGVDGHARTAETDLLFAARIPRTNLQPLQEERDLWFGRNRLTRWAPTAVALMSVMWLHSAQDARAGKVADADPSSLWDQTRRFIDEHTWVVMLPALFLDMLFANTLAKY